MAPQLAQGTQICWCDHQLCICRLQSQNKAWTVRALLLLLHTQSFSPSTLVPAAGQELTPSIPTPFLMGQRAHHLAQPCSSNQMKITPNYYHREAQAHPTSGMSPTREVISRRQFSHPAASLCRQGSEAQGSTHISQPFSVQEVEPNALEAIAAASSPHKLWSVNPQE